MSEKSKKTILWIVLILVIALHFPIPRFYKDGGTFELSAVLWKFTHWHVIADEELKARMSQRDDWETELAARWDEYYEDGHLVRSVFRYFPANLKDHGVLDP